MNISYSIIDDILTYFVRSGYINPGSSAGGFRSAGQWGYDWSLRSYSTAPSAYNLLIFNITDVSPSNTSYRYYGIPLRCLSTVLGI